MLSSYRAFHERTKVRLELAPLIDIVFILLIFFAVSTSLITNKQGINLILPEAETVAEHKSGTLVSIDENKTLYFEKDKIELKDLQSRVKTRVLSEPSLQIRLNAHANTPYVLVIQAMDHIRLGGCYDIVLEAKQKRTL